MIRFFLNLFNNLKEIEKFKGNREIIEIEIEKLIINN